MSGAYILAWLTAAIAVGWAIDKYLDRIRKYWNEGE